MKDSRIDQVVAQHAATAPDRPALTFHGQSVSYAGLEKAVAAMAGWLVDQGVTPGDRVALYARNHPESFITLLATSRIGALMLPLNWRLSEAELSWQMADAAPVLLLYGGDFIDPATRLATEAQCQSQEIGTPLEEARHGYHLAAGDSSGAHDAELLIVYTSGTTGRPKGAVLNQAAMFANANMSHDAYAMTADDVVLNLLPLFHVGGLNIQPLPALLIGASVIIHDAFDPQATLETITRQGITQITVVPTVLGALLNHPDWHRANLASLRMMAIGSTDVPVAMIEAVHARNIPMVQIYGATETSPSAIYQTAEIAFDTVGSIGRAGCACDIRIVDAEGQDLPVGETGEIWVRGPNILTRYWNNDDASRASITDGWFHTGDMARVDETGLYWFADRLKHVIISGGENIYPAELERCLSGMPGLAEFTVVGRPDPRWGEVPVVVAVKAEIQAGNSLTAETAAEVTAEVTTEAVMARFDGQVARFKQPKDVVFVDALPRNALGKIIADDVRALLTQPLAG